MKTEQTTTSDKVSAVASNDGVRVLANRKGKTKVEDFKEFIDGLRSDTALDAETKIEMLKAWKEKIRTKNTSRLMSKEEGNKHFMWLGHIEEAINSLAP